MERNYYTYIATNVHNTVLYTGITNDIGRRMDEHRRKAISGFTAKYNIIKLVWYETFLSPTEAIAAEKRIKGWRRERKLSLIKDLNPKFADLLHGDPSRGSG